MASLAFNEPMNVNDDGQRMTAERFADIIINYTRFSGYRVRGSDRVWITISNRQSTLFLREEVSAAINALYNRYRRMPTIRMGGVANNRIDEIVSTVLTMFFGNEILVNRMQIIQVINALEEHTRENIREAVGAYTFLGWVQTNLETNVDTILMQSFDEAPNLQVIRDDRERTERKEEKNATRKLDASGLGGERKAETAGSRTAPTGESTTPDSAAA